MFYQFNHPATPDYFKLETGENFNFPAHIHECFELITVRSGEMTVYIDGKAERLRQGNAVLIFPNQIHALESRESEHLVCIFSPKLVSAFSSKTARLLPTKSTFLLPRELREALLKCGEEESILIKKGLLYLICDAFDRERRYLPRTTAAQGLTDKIFLYIEKNYKEKCDLSGLAAELGYDYAYLSRYFKKTVGMGFNSYVNMYRLNHACYLLKNTKGSILDCAVESGYPSIRSFNRNFKLHFGMTPNEYREKQVLFENMN